MKVLVTGANGQLGFDVVKELHTQNHTVVAFDIDTLDITNEAAVRQVFSNLQPDAVIHCAAWTAVDAAEEPENFEMVQRINVNGTRYIAQACRSLGCKMLYLSTDYVFSGQGNTPWMPDCTDFNPQNVYGQSKLEGERTVSQLLDRYFIVRIAWVFGAHGKNFVRTMLQLAQKHDTIRVVNDQIGTPTYTVDLARLLVDMIATERYGYYHVTNEGGFLSWADFAREIFRQAGCTTTVIPVSTEEYGLSKAKRPLNSRLDKTKIQDRGFTPLPHWQDALTRFLKEI